MRKNQYNTLPVLQRFDVENRTGAADTTFFFEQFFALLIFLGSFNFLESSRKVRESRPNLAQSSAHL